MKGKTTRRRTTSSPWMPQWRIWTRTKRTMSWRTMRIMSSRTMRCNGGLPRVGFVFLCQVEDAEPVPQHDEVRDIRWMKVSELRKIFEDTPEQIFTLQLGVLEYYLQHDRSHP